ncbi:MAG: DUF4878 domain-containing protein [Bacteroidaceae bacterium]|nr:DUF4878 domain-containing protein [Bacteroidaceae bacterium]
MKKTFFSLFAVMAMTLMMFSCGGGGNTPTKVVEKSIKYIQDKDYAAYVDLIEFKEEQNSKEDKEQFVEFLEGMFEMTLEKKQGLASYEIISEEISEDGNSAVVVANITYGDGSSDEDKMKLIKNAEGEWKISMNK